MTLIKSISGIRGTIGGVKGSNLTAQDIVECAAGFGQWLINRGGKRTVVVGRDGRISGAMVSQLAVQTLCAMGIDVIDLGLSTTPTVEMTVPTMEAGAGIIFTASHNPKEWNALKFLNEKGEFISANDGEEILRLIEQGAIHYADVDDLGLYMTYEHAITEHIAQILELKWVDLDLVASKNFHVVVDCINSTGAISIPPLLDAMGVSYTLINEEVTGNFAHNPEPLEVHLRALSEATVSSGAVMGISVDPDVDRLAFISEDGTMFGEEYTLVAIADYMLRIQPGHTVSNLSSSRALKAVSISHGGTYSAAAVGEVNVVEEMKATNAIIGGEGNGGIILPELHYGRDALVGIAMFLTYVAKQDMALSSIKAQLPYYAMIKDKVSIEGLDADQIFDNIKAKFADEAIDLRDGIKIDFTQGWLHIRKSNTEAIIRIYAEGETQEIAQNLIEKVKSIVS